MMPIGSEVIYSGEKWINAIRGTQPVWGLQKSKENDEVNNSYSTQITSNKKTFADYLKEANEK
ncbi:MAG: hypothetical protein SPH83_10215 [Treponema sp.]|uniref:hypothetical protein n=1 Tax=Treponema bryantii TaxID=163 RepID=UPI0003B77ED7|nr:hypothetical protein [Treponema bryantii]MCI7567453.1 hypothetical protein [Treponema sp.]MDY6190856.1 hypothetical protein [Treponema sp.]